MQVAPSGGQICNQVAERYTQVIGSIPCVRCASGNVCHVCWVVRSALVINLSKKCTELWPLPPTTLHFLKHPLSPISSQPRLRFSTCLNFFILMPFLTKLFFRRCRAFHVLWPHHTAGALSLITKNTALTKEVISSVLTLNRTFWWSLMIFCTIVTPLNSLKTRLFNTILWCF